MFSQNETLTFTTRIVRFAEGTGLTRWPWRALGALTLAAAIWAGTTLATEAALTTVPPLTLSALRGSVGLLALWIAVRRQGLAFPRLPAATHVSLVGALDPGLTYIFGTIGLALSTASASVVIGAAEPLFTLLLAAWLLRERIGRSALSSLILAGIGMAAMLSPTTGNNAEQSTLLGNTLLLAATFVASLYVITTRRMVLDDRHDPLMIAALQQTVGVILGLLMLIGALVGGYETLDWAALNPAVLSAIVISGILGDALAFWLFLYGLRRVTAGTASLSMLLVPLFGLTGAAFLLGEQLHLAQIIGGILVLVAVAIVGRR